MNALNMQLTAVKIACLLLLSLMATACGMSVKDKDLEAEGKGANRVTVMSDGAYSMQLDTPASTCRRLADGHIKRIEYVHQPDPSRSGPDPDVGLAITLEIAGDLEAGDTVSGNEATDDR